MAEIKSRIEKGKELWEKFLDSQYKNAGGKWPAIIESGTCSEIISFLREENVSYENRPNAAHSFSLYDLIISGQNLEEMRASFLKLGLK